MSDFEYVGEELDLFARATNWKGYWSDKLRRYVGPRVLDVGAGLGATARVLAHEDRIERWCCLEPDPGLASRLEGAIARREISPRCEVVRGFLRDLNAADAFDSVLYIDVLEHIPDDRAELRSAERVLAPGGHIVVLAPAHNMLFSKFDESVGHYRRYDKRMLREIGPEGSDLVALRYLDSLGLGLSLANALVLKRSMPTRANVAFWDRVVVPASRLVDPLLGFTLGKSVVAVWRKR